MKILVLAQTPPPLHGQSTMVRTLVEGLGATGEFTVHHVNLSLSRDAADIGAKRLGKFLPLLKACLRAIWVRCKEGPMVLYYVPAPAKRSAIIRDWIVMILCRPFFPRLVLHWHAVGLGGWMIFKAKRIERWLTLFVLKNADLAIVLAPELAFDTRVFVPKRIEVVPNGVPLQGPAPARVRDECCEVLFLGLCSREKGFFETLEAVARANQRQPGAFRLTAAGEFPSVEAEDAYRRRAAELGESVRYVGFADEGKKQDLFHGADILCFPTTYPHEGQPLVLIEALAYDVPIVTTRWRAIPGMLPRENVWFVEPNATEELTETLLLARNAPRLKGPLREHFLRHFTYERHLDILRNALRSIDGAQSGNPGEQVLTMPKTDSAELVQNGGRSPTRDKAIGASLGPSDSR